MRPTDHPSDLTADGPAPGPMPVLLTVEEAAELLRIGRTTAYALTREWRATNGASGLPVINVGRKLRVPLRQLELLAGGPLAVGAREEPAAEPADTNGGSPAPLGRRGRVDATEPATPPPTSPPDRRASRKERFSDQPSLFDQAS